ncbi:MAG: hypothetical protein U0Z26_11835 [Anaerolineales bacterium]
MFDNLREEASHTNYDDDGAKFQFAAGTEPAKSSSGRFLGMTSMQRFVIAVMLMIAVCIIGVMALLALGKIGL